MEIALFGFATAALTCLWCLFGLRLLMPRIRRDAVAIAVREIRKELRAMPQKERDAWLRAEIENCQKALKP